MMLPQLISDYNRYLSPIPDHFVKPDNTKQTGMKTIYKIIIISMICLNVQSIKAQKPLVLSLDNAISYAIDHNKTLINSIAVISRT